VLIRTSVAQIREQGRSTQGVTLISLTEGEKLAGLERIEERELEGGNGNGNGNGGEPHGDDGAEPGPELDTPPTPTVH
jgi:DNA gyrase subunit A